MWWALAGPVLGFFHVYVGGHSTPRPVESLIRAVIYSILFTAVTVGAGIITRTIINNRRQAAFADTHRAHQQKVASLQHKYDEYVREATATHDNDVRNQQVIREAYRQMLDLLPQCEAGTLDRLDPTVVTLFGKDAQRWASGAKGEVATARLIDEKCNVPALVLHDVGVPDQDVNVDHIVYTPAGVYVIDSKNWSGRYTVRNNRLVAISGYQPHDDPGATLWWEIDQLTGAAPLLNEQARAIIVIHSGRVCDPNGTEVDRIESATSSARPVAVVSPRGLLDLIAHNPTTEAHGDVSDVMKAGIPLIENLGPAT